MNKKAIVIGAGITGLSSAWKLAEAGYKVKVMEYNDYIGGMSSTFHLDEYYLDYGPHKIFTVMDHIMEEIHMLFKDTELLTIEKKSLIRLCKHYLNYPVGIKDIFFKLGLLKGLGFGFGYIFAIVQKLYSSNDKSSYEDWVISRFGRPAYELVLGPYSQKIWGDPRQLSKDLAETRIAAPSLLEMIKQMLLGQRNNAPTINAEYFFYPPGGIIQISEKMAEQIRVNDGEIHLGLGLDKLECNEHGRVKNIFFSNGLTEELGEEDVLISTIPLPSLFKALGSMVPTEIQQALGKLKSRKLVLLYIVFTKERLNPVNWLFFPESKYIFNRGFEQKGFNPSMIPENKTVLCLEITCSEDDPIWRASDEEVFAKSHKGLEEAGLLEHQIINYFIRRLDNAYPIYDLYYKENLNYVMNYLDTITNLYSIGRQGCYSYAGMADCMDMGISTSRFIIEGKEHSNWQQQRLSFYDYVVVD